MLKRSLLNLCLLIVSLFFILLLLEGGLRLFSRDAVDLVSSDLSSDPVRFIPDPDTPENITEFDEFIGWRNVSGVSGEYYGPDDLRWRVEINSQGIRDREYHIEKKAGVTRIAVLGDSFAWGYGLKTKERFSDLLEERLINFEVLNFGLMGTSTDQQCLILERNALVYSPDVVILVVHDTDIWHNSLPANYGKTKPYFVLSGSGIQLKPLPKLDDSFAAKAKGISPLQNQGPKESRGIKTFFFRHSRLYRLVSSRLKRVSGLRKLFSRLGLIEDPVDSTYNIELTRRIITRMKKNAEAAGVKDFIVVLVPSKELIEFYAGGYLIKAAELSRREEESKGLFLALKKDGVPVVDLGPDFIRRAQAGEKLYFIGDNHWNSRANELAAVQLQSLLTQMGYEKNKAKP